MPAWPGGTLDALLAQPASRFVATNWEAQPLHVAAAAGEADRFATLARALRHVPLCARAVPALELDNLEVESAWEEALRDGAGGASVHGQDVRLVRCAAGDDPTAGELYYGADGSELDASTICAAQDAGYTVAVRAANLRSPAAAAAASSVSECLQLPCAVNVYITPPGARGLARHYDDHCAFVLQLAGRKRWRVCTRACGAFIPRLFARRGAPRCSPACTPLEVQLARGDVLYVPRGAPHDATAADDAGSEASVHATLAVEVPPPFEMSAALHVAVRLAAKEANGVASLAEALLHAALRSAGDFAGRHAAELRSACLPERLADSGMRYASLVGAVLACVSYDDAVSAAARFSAAGDEGVAWCCWLSHVPAAADEGAAWRDRADALCDAIHAAGAAPAGGDSLHIRRSFDALRAAAAAQMWPRVSAELYALRQRYLDAFAALGRSMRVLHGE